MALIDCPECSQQVSSHAWACPHCGFPVLEYGQQALENVTGEDHAKTGRQRSALSHLAKWGLAYREHGRQPPLLEEAEDRRERIVLRLLAGVLALVAVGLALLLLYGRSGG